MRTPRRLLVAVLATVVLSAVTSGASAQRLSLSQRSFRATWSSLTITPNSEFFTTGRCPVTLEGSFHSATFTKTAAALVGHVTRALLAACTGASATVSTETLPWHLRYRGFNGSLPTFTGVNANIVGARVQASTRELTCSLVSTAERPWPFSLNTNEAGTITGMRADESATISMGGVFLCQLIGYRLSGTSSFTQLGSAGSVSLRLLTVTDPSLSPSPTDFGRTAVEGVARRNVTITAGTDPLTVSSIRVSGSQYFAITDPSRCVGASLATRATCTFAVVCAAPAGAETAVEDTLTVETTIRTLRATLRGST